ncbi:MAG: hypothetical protein LBB73_09565 [Dysgonamonadaceae bacterium]|jgi:hypothetical protein|nr:hypothetical protein [Dysgonamonadaceae bacterium]
MENNLSLQQIYFAREHFKLSQYNHFGFKKISYLCGLKKQQRAMAINFLQQSLSILKQPSLKNTVKSTK